MCEDGEFLVHTDILKKIDKLFENFDNVYDLICHLHTLSYNEIHIEHVVFHFGCMVIIAMITICLPIVVKLSPGCTLSGKPWRTIMYANDYHLSTICLQNVYILENHSDRNGVQSENRDVHDCTPMITVCLPSVYRLLSIVSRKRTSWKTIVTAMVSKVKTMAYMIVRHGCQFVIIHTYRICMPSECNISFATRDLSSGDIVNDHLAYTCRNVLIENCESFKYLRSNDVNA